MASLYERFTNLWRDHLYTEQETIRAGNYDRLTTSPVPQKVPYPYTPEAALGKRIHDWMEVKTDAPIALRQFMEAHPGLNAQQLLNTWDREHPVIALARPTQDQAYEKAQQEARNELRNELRAQYGPAQSIADEQRITHQVRVDFQALRDANPGSNAVELLADHREQLQLERARKEAFDNAATIGKSLLIQNGIVYQRTGRHWEPVAGVTRVDVRRGADRPIVDRAEYEAGYEHRKALLDRHALDRQAGTVQEIALAASRAVRDNSGEEHPNFDRGQRKAIMDWSHEHNPARRHAAAAELPATDQNGQTLSGVWQGKLAQEWGLVGAVTDEQFERVTEHNKTQHQAEIGTSGSAVESAATAAGLSTQEGRWQGQLAAELGLAGAVTDEQFERRLTDIVEQEREKLQQQAALREAYRYELGRRIHEYMEVKADAPIVLRQFMEANPGLDPKQLLDTWDMEHLPEHVEDTSSPEYEESQHQAAIELRNVLRAQHGPAKDSADEQRIAHEVWREFQQLLKENPSANAVQLLDISRYEEPDIAPDVWRSSWISEDTGRYEARASVEQMGDVFVGRVELSQQGGEPQLLLTDKAFPSLEQARNAAQILRYEALSDPDATPKVQHKSGHAHVVVDDLDESYPGREISQEEGMGMGL